MSFYRDRSNFRYYPALFSPLWKPRKMFVAAKLGAQAASSCLPRVGVSRLRRFLERRVDECYRKNVARIVPQLQHEMARAEGRLVATEQEVCESIRALTVG